MPSASSTRVSASLLPSSLNQGYQAVIQLRSSQPRMPTKDVLHSNPLGRALTLWAFCLPAHERRVDAQQIVVSRSRERYLVLLKFLRRSLLGVLHFLRAPLANGRSHVKRIRGLVRGRTRVGGPLLGLVFRNALDVSGVCASFLSGALTEQRELSVRQLADSLLPSHCSSGDLQVVYRGSSHRRPPLRVGLSQRRDHRVAPQGDRLGYIGQINLA